jgi:hypothetical protein
MKFGQVHSASTTQSLPLDTDSVPFKFPWQKEQVLGSLLSDEFVTRQEEGWEIRAASHCHIKGQVKE